MISVLFTDLGYETIFHCCVFYLLIDYGDFLHDVRLDHHPYHHYHVSNVQRN